MERRLVVGLIIATLALGACGSGLARTPTRPSSPAAVVPTPSTMSGTPSPGPSSPAGGGLPSPRTGAAVAYDQRRHRLVVFGGMAGTQMLDDTWLWDGHGWTRLSVTGPSPRWAALLAYLPATGMLVLFGGRADENGNLQPLPAETWLFDGTSWSRSAPSHSPPSDYGFSGGLALDSASGRLVMEGVTYGSDVTTKSGTYLYDGTDWTVHDGLCPQDASWGSSCARMSGTASNPLTGHILLFGGGYQAPTASTSAFDGSSWTVLRPPHHPAAGYASAADDPDHDSVVVYTPADGDTWTWTGADWVEHPGGPVGGGSLAYDPDLHMVLMFGGGLTQGGPVPSSQLRGWDGNAWHLVPTT